MTYKYRNQHSIDRLTDGVNFPVANGNSDYEEFKRWVALGNTPEPADPPTPEELAAIAERAAYAADAAAAKAYAKLTALKSMTPAQVQAWVAVNVTNLAQAQDAIATLAIAVSLLARRL